MNDDDFEEFMKNLLRDASNGRPQPSGPEADMLEEMMKSIIMAQLMADGIDAGELNNIKVVRRSGPATDPDADLGWLDKYLK